MSVSFPKPISKAPFSFHCTICYDAFNLTDRPPVVLPCGHTYLCKPCSERLDRCMECRTPLTVKVKVGTRESSKTSLSSSSARVADRHGRYNQGQNPISPCFGGRPSGPSPIFEKVPIPIAKNHVLMCLMEAAMQDGTAGTVDDGEYDSGNDDEIVVRGMRVLSGSSGTYKVCEKKGLAVYSIPPKDNKTKVQSSGGYLRTLKYGQTVQISRFDDNFAMVARRVGYVLADMSSQLVKGKSPNLHHWNTILPTVRVSPTIISNH